MARRWRAKFCKNITQDSFEVELEVCPLVAVTNAVSWLLEGSRTRKKSEQSLPGRPGECVNLLVNANADVISSITPDGEFELMSYRLCTPPSRSSGLKLLSSIENWSRIECMVQASTYFKRRRSTCLYKTTPIRPVQETSLPRAPGFNVDTTFLHATSGSVFYVPDKSACVDNEAARRWP
ncbi:hypothetical protein OH76DRAFT_946682 [Lentinus brumalis]|uniref:Uncharacterized protein n=1 Tax=Lentinus brumalis TaxID=2498619 RepID=A0A371CZ51_9APHY|nr:hypothetical protein OH76DRAFT_946682 [Polyporus brumalis]